MSLRPLGVSPAGKEPTSGGGGRVVPVCFGGTLAAFHVAPHGYLRPVPFDARKVHSQSFGRRLPAKAQKARASSRSTQVTGFCSQPGGGARAPAPQSRRKLCASRGA